MPSVIKLKNGSGAPLASDLVQGEPALDLTNKRLYTEDSGGTVIEIGTNPTSLTAGSVTSTGAISGTTGTFSGAVTQEGNTVLDTADVGVSVQAYDADIAKLDVAQSWTAAQRGATQTASVTGGTTLDFSTYQNFVLTLTGNVTLDNPTTEVVGQSGFIVFIQDGTGSRTVSLGTDYETAGAAGLTLSTAAGTTDIVPYIVAASGRILLGAPQLGFA